MSIAIHIMLLKYYCCLNFHYILLPSTILENFQFKIISSLKSIKSLRLKMWFDNELRGSKIFLQSLSWSQFFYCHSPSLWTVPPGAHSIKIYIFFYSRMTLNYAIVFKAARVWPLSIHVWLTGWSECLSPSAKEFQKCIKLKSYKNLLIDHATNLFVYTIKVLECCNVACPVCLAS